MSQQANPERSYVRWFEDLDASAVPKVGGKNASLWRGPRFRTPR
jgi:hypothetical protein